MSSQLQTNDYEYLLKQIQTYFGPASIEARITANMKRKAEATPDNYKSCPTCKCPNCGMTRADAVKRQRQKRQAAARRAMTFVDKSIVVVDTED